MKLVLLGNTERLVEAGMKMMINNHTWAHRLLQIQETVDNGKE